MLEDSNMKISVEDEGLRIYLKKNTRVRSEELVFIKMTVEKQARKIENKRSRQIF